ncbi:FGGY-family carbohydrate kinase [Consotaella salsifontis]|uniref:Xylulokinase n=1 Tax=Consotaella salsifontis TaxID=1365950 RepID=A0A1T4S570_9HYPH|nr:FGGY family carbohydrate kinase [Consotaella salsifontis]SKA23375.1 xylulokinase [Consotaella salsifontis]SKA27301.1 xylulokinase [Consotaella salsifontis]
MDGLFCGIDIGSTNVKVAIVDAGGATLAAEARPTPRIMAEGAVETDAAYLTSVLEDMIVRAWRRLSTPRRILAISAAGVGEDGLMVDGDIMPVGYSIPWFDRRAEAEAALLAEHHSLEGRTGIAIDPTRTAAKWLWSARHRPQEFARGRWWISLTDYPLAKWAHRPFFSESLAVRSGCYDISRRAFLPELLEASRAPSLADVALAGSRIGTVGGQCSLVLRGAVAPGAALIAGGHDHPVAAALIRAGAPDAIVDSLGTAELLHAETGTCVQHHPPLVRSTALLAPAGEACLYVFELASQLRAVPGPALRDLLDRGWPEHAFSGREQAAALIGGEARPEALTGALQSGEPGTVWQLLEAVTFAARRIVEEMKRAGIPAGAFYTTGGWSRSDAFVRLRANVLGQTIHRVNEPELVALGAAFLAARGSGHPIARTLDTALFPPDRAAAEIHEARYRDAKEPISRLLGLSHPPRS